MKFVIEPGDELFRRLAPDTVDFSGNMPAVRLNAFYTQGKPDPEISVHVRRIVGDGQAFLDRIGRPHFGLAVLLVADVEELGFTVESDDSVDDPAHALIKGADSRRKCEQLAQIAAIYKLPSPKPEI